MNRIRADHASGVYHCISRVNGRLLLLDEPAIKERFVRMLMKVAPFCEMEVLAFCVMGNHFHVLVRERDLTPGFLDDRLLRQKIMLLYGDTKGPMEWQKHADMRRRGDDASAEANLRRYEGLMGDVSWFMRLLKQRFAVWYNRRHGRAGTLWAERFRSVLVEDSEDAIRTMAAYIDLNPVRAGIQVDPRRYRWSTVGAAAGGLRFAQRALVGVHDTALGSERKGKLGDLRRWPKVREWWDVQLAVEGEEIKDEDGKVIRRGVDPKVIRELMRSGGILSRAQVLRCRVRYFVDGGVIGSKEYVRQMVESQRGKLLPANRKSEGSRMGGRKAKLGELFSLRRLTAPIAESGGD